MWQAEGMTHQSWTSARGPFVPAPGWAVMPCTVSSWGPEPFQGSAGQISLLLTGTLTVDTSLHLSSSTSPSSFHLHLFQKKDLSFSEDEVTFSCF